MTTLGTLAAIRSGHAFRASLINTPLSETRVLQMKDMSLGEGIDWEDVVRCEPVGIKKEWLASGDILLVARGSRNRAYYLNEQPPGPTLAAPHFFHISLNKLIDLALLPEFLSWQLNQPPVQNYFKRNAEGSTSKSIRRVIVEKTPIFIPTLKQQEGVLKLHATVIREQIMAKNLIANGQKIMARICEDLVAEMHSFDSENNIQ